MSALSHIKPSLKPERPFFGVGPCAKFKGWDIALLNRALVSRSHRSEEAVARCRRVLSLSKELLRIPEDYQVAMIPGSATGAVEVLLWSLLGPRDVDVISYDVFGRLWLHDIVKELKVKHHIYDYPLGVLPSYKQENPEHDVVCVWNGSSAGICFPDSSFLAQDRTGLTIVDVTSAVFGMDIPWHDIDAAAWSWQKGMGGEAGVGMIALSPRALERLRSFVPDRPMPRLFRLAKNGIVDEGIFAGSSINTLSLLSLEDALISLEHLKEKGTLDDFVAHAQRSLSVVEAFIEKRPHFKFLVSDHAYRSPTTIAFTFSDEMGFLDEQAWTYIKEMCALLAKEDVAFDIKGHKLGSPCLRVWGGITLEHHDLKALFPWLDYAYQCVVNK